MKPLIVCVYKSGGDFTSKWVEALKSGLDEFFPTAFDFWCFTDKPEEVLHCVDSVHILKHDLPGWWSKIELFDNIYEDNREVIYFDLDVMPMRNLHEFYVAILEHPGPLMLRSSDRVGKAEDWPSSSIMSWTSNDLHPIYEAFMVNEHIILESKNNTARAGQQTDQGFIRTVLNPDKFQDVLPENYIVFKNEYLKDPRLFETAHILNWTGKPRYPNMGKDLEHIKSIWNRKPQLVK